MPWRFDWSGTEKIGCQTLSKPVGVSVTLFRRRPLDDGHSLRIRLVLGGLIAAILIALGDRGRQSCAVI